MTKETHLPVAIIGAGPVGLAAAAHLVKRKIPFVLFESGASVGSSILAWEHVRVFSAWKLNIDKAARELLEKTNWSAPGEDELPTGKEIVERYLKPLAQLPEFKASVFTSSKVISVGRKNLDKMKTRNRESLPFVLRVEQSGMVKTVEAKAVIDASGTWLKPNPVGSGGNFAIGEHEHSSRIFYGIPDVLNKYKKRYANKKIAVIGGGHSAFNTIFELEKIKQDYPQTEINWILRKQAVKDVFGGGENDALEARGALGIKMQALLAEDKVNLYTPFQVQEIRSDGESLTLIGEQNGKLAMLPQIDQIVSNTGSRPDFSFLGEIRLSINNAVESAAAIADLIDPNVHSCGTVRPHGELELRHDEKDFYIVGSKSYGRAPTFLMATGYEQVRSIVAALDGDMEAARKVELELPETGVCSAEGGGCCGTGDTAETKEAACCG